MRSRYSLLFLLFSCQFIWAQKYYPTEEFTINQGLSNNEITCLYEDNNGFLWIGTTDGLNRFDGYSFTKYSTELDNSSSIPNDHIYKIAEDKYNNLWCASEGGLFKLNLLSNHFSTFSNRIDTLSFPEYSPVYDFTIDTISNHIFFIGKHFYGKLDLSSEYIERYPINSDYSLGNLKLNFSIETKYNDNRILFANNDGVFCHNIENDSLTQLFKSKYRGINSNGIEGIKYGLNGEIWLYYPYDFMLLDTNQKLTSFPTFKTLMNSSCRILSLEQKNNSTINIFRSGDVISFDFKTFVHSTLFEYSLPIGSNRKVTALIRDRSGIYWVGTNNGLFKYNPHKFTFKHYFLPKSIFELYGDEISSAVFDANGKLWLGLNSGNLLIVDPEKGNFQNSVLIIFQNNSKINLLKESNTGNIYVCSDEGLTEYFVPQDNAYKAGLIKTRTFPIDDVVYSMNDDDPSAIWIAAESEILLLEYNMDQNSYSNMSSVLELSEPCFKIVTTTKYVYFLQSQKVLQLNRENSTVKTISLFEYFGNSSTKLNTLLALNEEDILIGTTNGLFQYNANTQSVSNFKLDLVSRINNVNSLITDMHGKIWMSTSGNIVSINHEKNNINFYSEQDGLNTTIFAPRGASKSSDGKILFFGKDGFVTFDPDSLIKNVRIPNVVITSAILTGKEKISIKYLFGADTLNVQPGYRNIKINFAALNFWNPKRNQFKYSLERLGKADKWQSLGNTNHVEFFGLKAGIYSFKILGSNSQNIWNPNPCELIIFIKAPIWQSRIAIVFYTIALIILFYFSVYFKTRQLRKINREYKEREHIGKKIELQKEELSLKNKNITDSINYAKRIQMALMPSQKLFSKLFPDSFILHIPKDIVSGDFYWINEVGGRIYFASVDCTGHGVPGAFMSVIGFELFRRITETEKKKQPAEILNSLNRGFESIFSDVDDVILRDGMDVAFCAIDHDMQVLEFAGAFNPLYLVRDNTITEIKGDRFSVGLNEDDPNGKSFNNHVIPLSEGDVIYIFTDGFADQFGGPEGKKYKYRRFRHLLLALHQLPMKRQGEFLRRSILDWKGSLDQVDDILVVGIKIGKSYTSKS